jgi:hypothetical protein
MSSVIHTLKENAKVVQAFPPATPNSAAPDRVSLKEAAQLAIVIAVNNATTVTGSAVTLLQSTDVGGGSEKALAFDLVEANLDTDAAGLMTETAVVSNTFTTTAVDNKNALYLLEVRAEDLDVANGFDCVRLGLGNGANTVIAAQYILYGSRYANSETDPTAN